MIRNMICPRAVRPIPVAHTGGSGSDGPTHLVNLRKHGPYTRRLPWTSFPPPGMATMRIGAWAAEEGINPPSATNNTE